MRIKYPTAFFILLLMLKGCSLSYVIKQGTYQMDLLLHAQPMTKVLRSKDLNKNIRKKLELIKDVQEFATGFLGLKGEKNYKSVSLSFGHKLYSITASEPLRFRPYQWWFPIVGHVSYKGFFDEKDADKELRELAKKGYDTQKRRVGAYSTLGFFADPVWPSMLKMSDEALIELIIHELAHATVYAPGQTTFNETLANFISLIGAKKYASHRFGDDSPQLLAMNQYHDRLRIYRKFFNQLYFELNEMYLSKKNDDEKRTAKKLIIDNAHNRYAKISDKNQLFIVDWDGVNNAFLMSFKIYNHDDSIFWGLLKYYQGDLKKFIQDVEFYGPSPNPFEALKNRLARLVENRHETI